MLTESLLYWWLAAAGLAFVVLAILWRPFFSRKARELRRRSKNYGRVISRKRSGLTVKLSAKTPREKTRK